MSILLLSKVTSVGASRSVKTRGVTSHTVDIDWSSLAATPISAVTVVLQGSSTNADEKNGVITNPTFAIGSAAAKFSNAAFDFIVDGTSATKAVNTIGTVFTAAHVVSSSKYGVINIYIKSDGTWLTKVPKTPQDYASAALAHTAGDGIAAPAAAYIYVGRILIANDSSTWTANTHNLTNAGDVTTATFLSVTSSFYALATHVCDANEITAHRAMFHRIDKEADYTRVYLSTLTGTGEVNVRYSQVIQRVGG